jgi:RimJ/RimL family protein N-acetyltransferase
VESDEELLWLAPSTVPPLTVEKVTAWKKPNGEAFLLTCENDPLPIGYGELNPMRHEPDHLWLGHIIVSPPYRRQGTGQAFIQAMLDHAFHRFFASRVSLIVFPANQAAVRCYRRVGFMVTSEEYHRFGTTGKMQRLLRLEIEAPAAEKRRGLAKTD